MVDFETLRVGFAFTAGAATFFAPCAFPLLPGYIAFYLGHRKSDPGTVGARLRRAGIVGVIASVGFFLVYTILAGIVLAFGTRLVQNISALELVVGVLVILLGSAMATDRINSDRLHLHLPERRRSPMGFLTFGIVYATAAAGCTAPIFVAVAAFALAGGPVSAVATLGSYAAGMSVLMVAVTLVSALGRQQLLHTLSGNSSRITRIAGVLLILAGLAQIYLFLFRFGGMQLLGPA